MADRPLSENQQKIMELMADGKIRTPAWIAHGIGIHLGPERRRGPWSGRQNPAQYIISALTGLHRRKLLSHARRPDGMSGTAYVLAGDSKDEEEYLVEAAREMVRKSRDG